MSSGEAVVSIFQVDRAASRWADLARSTFVVSLLNPDDYTDLGAIPGLAAGEWIRVGQDDAVDVAVAIGDILTENRIAYRVEWP
jgi:translation initiation factor IF-1